MLIIGELINSTREKIKEVIADQDADYIKDIAQKQVQAGADYIDVNAGAFSSKEEPEYLEWLVKTVQSVVDKPLALDSPNPEALERAIKLHKGQPIINSITAETDRYQEIISLIQKYEAKVVALCMDNEGMPDTAEQRLNVAESLLNDLENDGVSPEKIFLDPLIKPISIDGKFGPQVLKTVKGISSWETGVHITCGLRNISHGLPNRVLLNRAYLILLMGSGLDSAILDPLDDELMKLVKATRVLLNRDPYGIEYIKAARAGELD